VPVLVTLVGVGAVFGAVEVAAAALAERAGDAALSGPLLAAFAAGSAVGGLAYGARAWRMPTRIRLVAVTAAMVAATGVTAAVTSRLPDAPEPLALVAVAALLALVGLFLAPAMVTGYLVADERTSDAVRTEASAWVNTAVNTGVALAAAGVGAVVDAAGPGSGLAVGTAGALGLAALAMPALLLRRRAAAEPT
jgi:predicted MFS family arabinose efflux permease